MPGRIEPLGTEVDHHVSAREGAGVGAPAGPLPCFEDHHTAPCVNQIASGHQTGESGPDNDDVMDLGCVHSPIVARARLPQTGEPSAGAQSNRGGPIAQCG